MMLPLKVKRSSCQTERQISSNTLITVIIEPGYSRNDGHSYKEGGIYAAAFLKWASKRTETDLVYRLNKTLQDGSFDKSFWKNETGMSLEQLWSLYQKT